MSEDEFGKRIASLRLERGWSQQRLSDVSGLSKRTIERAESGKAVSRFTLGAIADALEMSLAELRSSSEEEPEVIRLTFTVDVPAANPKRASRIISSILQHLNGSERQMVNGAKVPIQ